MREAIAELMATCCVPLVTTFSALRFLSGGVSTANRNRQPAWKGQNDRWMSRPLLRWDIDQFGISASLALARRVNERQLSESRSVL
jgi:hypothetical protein